MSTIACLVEGGPDDGRCITVSAHVNILRVPHPSHWPSLRPSSLRRRQVEPKVDYAEYRRYGRRLRWTGLVDDAKAEMRMSMELGLSAWVRAEVRRTVRGELTRLAGAKGLGRIFWDVRRDNLRGMYVVTAAVGPNRERIARGRR